MDAVTWRDAEVVRWIEENGIAVQIDVDAETELAKQLEIRSMPTVIAFKGGEEKDRIVGYREAQGLLGWLDGLTRGETDLDRVRKAVVDPTTDVRGRHLLARGLVRSGRKEEATKELVWLWQNMARVDPAMGGVRVSYLAHEIETLIASHAPARTEFAGIRDALESTLKGDAAASRLDWIVLNEMLGDEDRTFDWYDAARNDPNEASAIDGCAHRLVELLIQRECWEDVGRLYRDPVAELTRRHETSSLPADTTIPPDMRSMLEETMARSFRERAALLFRCLVAAGRSKEANALKAEALRLDPSDAMEQALANTATPSSGSDRDDVRGAQPADALAALRRSVEINRKRASSSPALARALANSLWKLDHALKDPSERAEALAVGTEAVAVVRPLAESDNSTLSLESLAISLHNLSIRQGQMERYAEAIETAIESAGLYEKLSARLPAADRGPWASTLMLLAGHQGAIGLTERSLENSALAVAMYRELAVAKVGYLSELAGALMNLGGRQNALGFREAALKSGLEATALRRQLVARNPDESTRASLAACLTNLEAYQGGLGLRKEAMATAVEGVALHRTLVASDREAFLPNLALGLVNLSVSQSRLGLRREAHGNIAEAVTLFREADAATPGEHDTNLSMSLLNLGVYQGAIGLLQEAVDSTEEAVRIRRGLAASNPGAFRSRLGLSLNNLAYRRTKLGLHEEALAPAIEAVSVLRSCAAAKPSAFRPNLADSLHTLGEVQSDLGQGAAAVDSLSEAAAIRRELTRDLPSAFEPGLAKTLSRLGAAQCALRDAGRAVSSIEEAVSIQRRLVLTDEAAFLPDLATSLDNLGVAHLSAGAPGEAVAAATEAVALHRQLADAHPESFRSELAKSLYDLGTIHSAAGRRDEALAAGRESADIYTTLVTRFPRAFAKRLEAAQALARTASEGLGLPTVE
jgi:tetratricopeptide (TPR) repeat protein